MARFQRLSSVCNGGHLWNLNYLTSVQDMEKALHGESKAILVVGRYQRSCRSLLTKLKRSKTWTAKCVGPWSVSSELWYIRRRY